MNATDVERLNYSISQNGLHWETIDEDISIEGLLAGRGTRPSQVIKQLDAINLPT